MRTVNILFEPFTAEDARAMKGGHFRCEWQRVACITFADGRTKWAFGDDIVCAILAEAKKEQEQTGGDNIAPQK